MNTTEVTLTRNEQRALADKIGVLPGHLRGWLEGSSRPAPWVARIIARELDSEPGELWPLDTYAPPRSSDRR